MWISKKRKKVTDDKDSPLIFSIIEEAIFLEFRLIFLVHLTGCCCFFSSSLLTLLSNFCAAPLTFSPFRKTSFSWLQRKLFGWEQGFTWFTLSQYSRSKPAPSSSSLLKCMKDIKKRSQGSSLITVLVILNAAKFSKGGTFECRVGAGDSSVSNDFSGNLHHLLMTRTWPNLRLLLLLSLFVSVNTRSDWAEAKIGGWSVIFYLSLEIVDICLVGGREGNPKE